MLTSQQIEGLRYSFTASKSLTSEQIAALIESCAQLTQQHEQIVSVLRTLPTSWATVRALLNDLARLVHEP